MAGVMGPCGPLSAVFVATLTLLPNATDPLLPKAEEEPVT